jgi:hypothetical protein
MALSERLALLVTLDAKGAIRGLENVGKAADRNLSKTSARMDAMGQKFQKVGVGLAATGGLLAVGLFKAAQASEEANLAVVKLDNSLKNNPRLAGESSKAFIDLAASIQDKTAADGDAIVAGQAMLATFKVTGEQIRTLTPLVVDYARKFGTDLVSANAAVGKALDGSVGALKRNGVSIDETLFKTDRYAAVQKALAEQVGGFAEAEGKTFAGSLERLNNQLGDLAEGVGTGAVDAFSSMVGAADPLIDRMNALDPAVQSTVGKVATFGSAGLIAAGGLSFVVGKAIELRSAIKDLPSRIGDLVGGLSGLKTKATIAAGGIGILALVMFDAQQDAARLKEVVAGLRDEAERTGDSLKDVAERQFVEVVTSSDDARRSMELLGLSFKDLADPLQGTDAEFKEFSEGLTEQAAAAGVAQGAVNSLLAPMGRYRKAVGEATDAETAAATASTELGLANEGAVDPTAALADANGGLTDEVNAAADAIKGLNDALHAQFDPLFAAQDAQLKLAEAQAEANAAIKEFGPNSEEAAAKNRELVRAALDSESSLLQLAEAAAKGDVDVDAFRETLTRWTAEGKISEQAAAEAAYAFGVYAANAESVPEKVSTTVSTPGLERANTLAKALLDNLNAIDGGLFGKITGAGGVAAATIRYGSGGTDKLEGRAKGGPVDAGTTYMVGEKGPELFEPSVAGKIIPNNKLNESRYIGEGIGGLGRSANTPAKPKPSGGGGGGGGVTGFRVRRGEVSGATWERALTKGWRPIGYDGLDDAIYRRVHHSDIPLKGWNWARSKGWVGIPEDGENALFPSQRMATGTVGLVRNLIESFDKIGFKGMSTKQGFGFYTAAGGNYKKLPAGLLGAFDKAGTFYEDFSLRLDGAGRAMGGPVEAGTTYMVGERGPELLTMGSSGGHVTPNHALGGGGNNYHLTVYAMDPRTAGGVVVDAIKDFEASNGKGWRET